MEKVSLVGCAGHKKADDQTNFREGNGKVYMTHATKAIYGLTMMDTVRIK